MPRFGSAGCRSENLNDNTINNKPAKKAARRHTRETLPAYKDTEQNINI